MFSRLKSSLTRTGLAAFMAASSPAFSDSQQENKPVVVERHVIFMVDISKSVDDQEYKLMMEGIARALISETAKNQFDSGVSYGLSVVFFWGSATTGLSSVVSNSKEAAVFANGAFYNFETGEPYPRYRYGHDTSIVMGFMQAQALMREEPFIALSREILVVGDGVEKEFDEWALQAQQAILAQTYGAVVSGVPVLVSPDQDGEDLVRHYAQYVITPENMQTSRSGFALQLKAGHSYPATGFPGIETAVTKVIEYALN